MVESAVTKVTRFGGNRHHLYLRSDLVADERFPFDPSEPVVVRIEGERLVVERAKGKGRAA